MSESLIPVLSGLCLFALGVVIGVLFQRNFTSDADKNRRLEQKLAETQDQFSRYQADVSAHFMETANLVRTLNRSYRDVHTQLVKGATRLCGSDQADEFVGISFDADATRKRTFDSENVSPPIDYAPKTDPEDEGMLSENYGLNTSTRKKSDNPHDDNVEMPPRF